MRPEQEYAVDMTMKYFKSAYEEGSGRTPKFLWNAKMRFGKTFAAYQLAKKMGMKRVLILTFKPAVQTAWREDLLTHMDFEGWQFITRPTVPGGLTNDQQYQRADKSRPIVCFGSFQDFLGVNKETGGIKANNEWVHTTNWDLVIFDEYHFGAWKDSAKKLFEQDEDTYEEDLSKYDAGNAYDETWLPITTTYYLYLSGTPFRALNSGEFIEEQIYNWTYSDEQRAKAEWKGEGVNPYAALPRMVMLTYKIPESIQRIAKQGEFDEFDLNVFFSAEGIGKDAHFKYEDYVQKWLDLIRGSYLETSVDELKLGAQKPPMPYSDTRLLNVLSHTLWFMPNVASCYAMANLLAQKQNAFYHDYKVNVCAGTQAGIGVAALEPVRRSIQEKLIKFATRVPVFMYLTDYREYSLQDVITQLEPELFKKVTGLDVKDFELLVSLNVFNEALMNDAVYKFKRYEDASLIYTGIDKHTGENVGLYSTVISRADYDAMAGQLAASMTADAPRDDDLPERPVFTNISSYDFDDEEDELPKVAEPKAKYETKRKPLVEPSKPVSTPTYRPSYVPPTPSVAPVVKKPTVHIDTSKVHAGTIVSHKAFGPGQVKGIDGGLIVVVFGGVDKKFQFPGAFEQGFLKLDE